MSRNTEQEAKGHQNPPPHPHDRNTQKKTIIVAINFHWCLVFISINFHEILQALFASITETTGVQIGSRPIARGDYD